MARITSTRAGVARESDVVTAVAKQKKNNDVPKPPADRGEPVSVKLYRQHARKLSELAFQEELDGGAAEAFDRHFAALLDNLLIAATDARLKRLREEQNTH